MTIFEQLCVMFIPAIIAAHVIGIFLDDNSKFQKKRLRNALDRIYDHIKLLNETAHDGIKFHEVKVIYKNREFRVGLYKTEHSNRYTTYEIFINGAEAGMYHQIGDCCTQQYYFEALNHRHKDEVIIIVKAASKELKKQEKKAEPKTGSWNEHSYFK